MHGILDPIDPVAHEPAYRDLVVAAGHADKLVQVSVDTWHGPYSAAQYIAALVAIEHWLDTGVKPDASFFPDSQGFVNGFIPPPWTY